MKPSAPLTRSCKLEKTQSKPLLQCTKLSGAGRPIDQRRGSPACRRSTPSISSHSETSEKLPYLAEKIAPTHFEKVLKVWAEFELGDARQAYAHATALLKTAPDSVTQAYMFGDRWKSAWPERLTACRTRLTEEGNHSRGELPSHSSLTADGDLYELSGELVRCGAGARGTTEGSPSSDENRRSPSPCRVPHCQRSHCRLSRPAANGAKGDRHLLQLACRRTLQRSTLAPERGTIDRGPSRWRRQLGTQLRRGMPAARQGITVKTTNR